VRLSAVTAAHNLFVILSTATFIPLHSSVNQKLFKKCICNESSHYEKYGWCRVPQLSSETEISVAFSVRYAQLVTQQYKIEKHLCNQGSHYENTDDYAKEAITCNHPINAFHCQQR